MRFKLRVKTMPVLSFGETTTISRSVMFVQAKVSGGAGQDFESLGHKSEHAPLLSAS